MATATATPAVISWGIASKSSAGQRKTTSDVCYVRGLNSYGGLKAQNINNNKVVSMGMPVSTEQSFANVVMSLKKTRGGRGGALSTTCNAVGEIFKIAAIMNALTLVGVAVGFVLLRIEASVEEAD